MLGVLCRGCPDGVARAEGFYVQATRSLGCLHRACPGRIAETKVGTNNGGLGIYMQRALWQDS